MFSPVSLRLKLIPLEKLILDDVNSKYLGNALNYLPFLPCLSSLIIICEHRFQNKSIIYYQILRLPALKYCKISLNEIDHDQLSPHINEFLPMATNKFSAIGIFIINHLCSFADLSIILSYGLQLRRLFTPYLFGMNINHI
jgi:hypothetical protein